MTLPKMALNWINGSEMGAATGEDFAKLNPASEQEIARIPRSTAADIDRAVEAASAAFPAWSILPAVRRGQILQAIADAMRARRSEMAAIVALETGKSLKDALGETDGAIQLGHFFAGEGMRLYGRTTTSAVPGKTAATIRCPIGIAGLIIAANTPIANVAWKVFPALICGNTAVLKAAEDTPLTAWLFGQIAREAGLPNGVLNIVQGTGIDAGAPLAEHPDVAVLSFTGSTAVGRRLAEAAGKRLARISLELGGKNAFIVCDDADIDNAVRWAALSAFSNAGQRCAAGSRLIVFDSVYETFRERLLATTRSLKLGTADTDDLGPVINGRQISNMVRAVDAARQEGATVLCGGMRLDKPGYFLSPCLIENCDPKSALSRTELFGPIASLYRVAGYHEAIAMANDSPYGLTAAIHTKNIDRAMHFVQAIQAGVATVNGGTYGSEPHMPFGGVRQSGNGSREPGTEALDVYSSLKDVYMLGQQL